ncbi:hypothetical protein D3C81_1376190 [compost metagenome]
MHDLRAAGVSRHRHLAHLRQPRLVGDKRQQVVQHLQRTDRKARVDRVLAAHPALYRPLRHAVETLALVRRAGEVGGDQQDLVGMAAAGLEQGRAGGIVVVAVALQAVLHEHHLADTRQVAVEPVIRIHREVVAGARAQVDTLPVRLA